MTLRSIPVVDAARLGDEALVAPLIGAFRDLGFVALRGHGVGAPLIEACYEAVGAFFALPDQVKRRYHVAGGGGARGYTPFAVEKAKDQTVADLKEFWHVGRELPAGASADDYRAAGLAPNVWPREVPGFREATLALYRALDSLGARVLRAIARGFELSPDHFEGVVNRGNSILRPLHYPPLSDPPQGAVRSAAHEDINLITLLVGAREPGLQILTRDGDWIDAPAGEDLIICNVGDMLQRLTNHVLPSTTHRVINPPPDTPGEGDARNVSRYSIPFFLHPNSDFLIETLPSCMGAGRENRYPEPILADDYLQERLREIGLI
jgi:isopenicillin N synthase-like dioxygenase